MCVRLSCLLCSCVVIVCLGWLFGWLVVVASLQPALCLSIHVLLCYIVLCRVVCLVTTMHYLVMVVVFPSLCVRWPTVLLPPGLLR